MVLQSNYAKRANSENTPPSLSMTRRFKQPPTQPRSSIQDAARRRRGRTNGSRPIKYIVEQAKRRTASKTPPTPLRFTVDTTPTTSQDVDMQSAETSNTTADAKKSIPVLLPRELLRPDYCEVSRDAIKAVDPALADTNLEYIRDHMEDLGPGMLRVLSTVKASPAKDVLPKELSIIVHDTSSILPTHMFAVYGSQSKANPPRPRKVTLYPIHSLVFAAHCSRLPPFPASTPPQIQQLVPQHLTVPVRPLCLPSPQSYPHLASFLYTKRADILLNSLLPCPPTSKLENEDSQLVSFATRLAGTYTLQILLQHVLLVHGLWQNVCALGVFDDDLWDTMDLAWKILLTALAYGTGNPQMMASQP